VGKNLEASEALELPALKVSANQKHLFYLYTTCLEKELILVDLFGTRRAAKFSESPRFVSVSYVWGTLGSSSLQHTIHFDSCKIDITPNCFNALRAIQQQNTSMPILIDAVCI
jgi:hypothetical protein